MRKIGRSNQPPRKPAAKVLTINGHLSSDVVTGADFAHVAQLQYAAFEANEAAVRALLDLRNRLATGARDESTGYYLDGPRGMVRSRKASGE